MGGAVLKLGVGGGFRESGDPDFEPLKCVGEEWDVDTDSLLGKSVLTVIFRAWGWMRADEGWAGAASAMTMVRLRARSNCNAAAISLRFKLEVSA